MASLAGPSLAHSCQQWQVVREGLQWSLHPCMWLRSTVLLPWPLGFFFQRHSLLYISSLSFPQLCLWSQQQSFPWDCSPIPTLQIPAPVGNSGHSSQSEVCRVTALIVWFSLYSDWQISCLTLLWKPQMLPFCPNWFPWVWESHLCFSSLTLQSYFSPPSPFFHPIQSCMDPHIPFQRSRIPASNQPAFCEDCCVRKCISDVVMERDALHTHPLLHPSWFPSLLLFNIALKDLANAIRPEK